MIHRIERPYKIAIAGASTLRGKELKQVLEDRNFPAADYVLLDQALSAGTLTEAGGEPTFIRPLDAESFEGAQFVFFAGRPQEAENDWPAARRAGATVIDLSGGLSQQPGVFPWIPRLSTLLSPPGHAARNGSSDGALYSSPPPSVTIACTISAALQSFAPQRLAILFFPPVSERDQAGIDELENQTTNLLSFRPISQSVFDAQVAFNLLTGYGEASRPGLSEVREEIVSGVSRYLAGRLPMPAIQLIQAPVFYGYGFAAYVELSTAQDLETIEAALRGAGICVAAENEPPSNVSVAGQNEIQSAHVVRDSSIPTGVWLWGVADNLRLAASNAVQIAEELIVSPV